jgi:hypothetical protein
VIAINMTGETVALTGPDGTQLAERPVTLATEVAAEGLPFPGTLPADGAVVLELGGAEH